MAGGKLMKCAHHDFQTTLPAWGTCYRSFMSHDDNTSLRDDVRREMLRRLSNDELAAIQTPDLKPLAQEVLIARALHPQWVPAPYFGMVFNGRPS